MQLTTECVEKSLGGLQSLHWFISYIELQCSFNSDYSEQKKKNKNNNEVSGILKRKQSNLVH
jgi:hypothetical protein